MADDVTTVVVTDEVAQKAAEMAFIRAERSELKRREDTLRTELLAALDGAEVGLTASGALVAEVTTSERVNVDRNKLEALYPEVFAAVRSTTSVVTVKLPKAT